MVENGGKASVSGLFTHVLFGPNDSVTAEEYFKKIGNKTVVTTFTSQQIHQIPLISVDTIERFSQGKAIVLNPSCGNNNDVKRPVTGKIGVPKEDINRVVEAETVIWKEKSCLILAQRKAQSIESREQNYIDISKLNDTQKQDWTTEQLNFRVAAAEELLPMPPNSDKQLTKF